MRPGDAIPAVDVERVLAATILDRDARDVVRSACNAVLRTGRHQVDAVTVRAALDRSDVAGVLSALYRAGQRLAASAELGAHDAEVSFDDLNDIVTAERLVSTAHAAVLGALVARALRRPS